jgi:predicted ATP-dependent protease
LPAVDADGLAALVEEGARRSGFRNQHHLTTDLLELHDLVYEAERLAWTRHDVATSRGHVAEVVERRRKDYGLAARLALEDVLTRQHIVPTAGADVGQINILYAGMRRPFEASHGGPDRLTVTVSPGRKEHFVDVEGDAQAADKDHMLGALTMAGYLAYRYRPTHPISLTARIRGEERFAGDSDRAAGGPSSSAAELFALLTALADVPIYSSLAVTGVAGQHGEIQAIGGVNFKIEGFWELCDKRRHDETPLCPAGYGVLIPVSNAQDLMLRPEVARSIAEDGWFHVWPIATVDEGLELLTGRSANEVHKLVARRLRAFYEQSLGGRAPG